MKKMAFIVPPSVEILDLAGPAQPEAGRKPIRSAPGAEPQATAARQRGEKEKAARSLRAFRRCMAGSADERPAAPQAPAGADP